MNFFKIIIFILIIIVGWFSYTPGIGSLDINENVKTILKKRLINVPYSVNKEVLSSPIVLSQYYKKNDYTSVWLGKNGLLHITDSLISKIKESVFDGLNPYDYHLSEIERLNTYLRTYKGQNDDPNFISSCTDFEMLMSDAFFTYASHQYVGKTRSNKYNKEWKIHLKSVSLIDSLKIGSDEKKIKKILNHFSCIHPSYQKLKVVLKNYIEVKNKGGWILLPAGIKLKVGDKNSNVVLLRRRLCALQEKGNVEDSIFDNSLEKLVKTTQSNYGLEVNGIIDSYVIKALNVSIEERISQIKLNMERWRWLPHHMPQLYVMVNTAGFVLDLTDNNKSVLSMKIIAGTTTHHTPIFSADMTYIVLNPWWDIPASIARNEIIPKTKRNPSYLKQENIKVYKSRKEGGYEVSARSINWKAVNAKTASYRFRQTPGPWNALGQIKFIFPNPYNIYLHDTPGKHLFSKTVRTFSHGCIRIEKPLDLATYLLRNDPNWTREKLTSAINLKKEKKIVLDDPVKVYVYYYTSWVDEEDNPCFRWDIYGFDRELKMILSDL